MVRRGVIIGIAAVLMCVLGGAETQGKEPVVLFDQGHGQRFLVEQEGGFDLSGLAGLFRQNGFSVETTGGEISDAVLEEATVLIVSGAFAAVTEKETDAILGFVRRGGKLCGLLHIAPPVSALLGRFGVTASDGVLHEAEDLIAGQPRDFYVTRFGSHPVVSGIRRISVRGGWGLAVNGENGTVVAETSANAWIDLNRNGRFDGAEKRGAWGLVVAGNYGRGAFIFFGDDAVFQNKFLLGDNFLLAGNLVAWLRP